MIEYWHNPRCSKSRQGLALLQDQGAKLTLRRYLEDPPSRQELEAVHRALGRPPVCDMMRKTDKLFAELGLSCDMSESDLLTAMSDNPALIERPLAITEGRAVIGRPPEVLLDLL